MSDLAHKVSTVLKLNKKRNKANILSIKSYEDRETKIKELLKKKYPEITDEQLVASKTTIQRYLKDDWINNNAK